MKNGYMPQNGNFWREMITFTRTGHNVYAVIMMCHIYVLY